MLGHVVAQACKQNGSLDPCHNTWQVLYLPLVNHATDPPAHDNDFLVVHRSSLYYVQDAITSDGKSRPVLSTSITVRHATCLTDKIPYAFGTVIPVQSNFGRGCMSYRSTPVASY